MELELKVEYLPISELKKYENNAKIHTEDQIKEIAKSIQEAGMCDPIGIWKDNTIIEGHGRLMACQQLNMKTVPVIRLNHLTDEQRRAYMLIHNKTTMNTGFDMDLLKIELDNIVDIDMSDFGFDDIEIFKEEQKEKDLREVSYNETISVVINCKNENEAEQIFNKLTSEGYECHISTL